MANDSQTSLLSASTICAVATAPGTGGIAVIRLSGPMALGLASQHLIHRGEAVDLSLRPARHALYAEWHDAEGMVDDVVVLPYVAPHSYTGENIVEISCHGSSYIVRRVLESLVTSGAEIARAGEFTMRAYLNGRLDLAQAEAVADIIASQTQTQHRQAMQQMRGGYSASLASLRAELLRLTALMELELDFSEEDVTFADRSELSDLSAKLRNEISRLVQSYRLGNAVRNGIPVAIVGATNVGKSTLLNALLGEERAIVSDIHGTTRDTIEDTTNIGGFLFRFVDTAGLRQTDDEIEALGIERSRVSMRSSAIVLGVLDGSRFGEDSQTHALEEIISTASGRSLVLLINKCDLLSPDERTSIIASLACRGIDTADIIAISAHDGQDVDVLRQRLASLMQANEFSQPDIIVSNARHLQLLNQSLSALERLLTGLADGTPTDLLTLELRHAIRAIGEITGQAITSGEALHYIFAHFCIGK